MCATLIAALTAYTAFLAVDGTVGRIVLRKTRAGSFLVNMLLLIPYAAIIWFLLTLVEG